MTAVPGNVRSIKEALHEIGWSITVDDKLDIVLHAAVGEFQHGWTPDNLLLDGDPGPITCKALNDCLFFGGHCSPNFTYREFKSKGDGWIKANRTLIRGLEKYRTKLSPGGVTIVSGYRDPAHNKQDGGASNSQHLYGAAADIPMKATFQQIKALGVFSGIGIQRSNGLVRHVDVRGQDGAPATSAGTPASPSIWYY